MVEAVASKGGVHAGPRVIQQGGEGVGSQIPQEPWGNDS